jgi:cyclophilin family peptidyl-prolyl cis-trans isomerase
MGTGSGDAGYKQDEFSDLRFDNSGVFSNANNGPSTNSQFYYTCSNAMVRWKTHYFGHVVKEWM